MPVRASRSFFFGAIFVIKLPSKFFPLKCEHEKKIVRSKPAASPNPNRKRNPKSPNCRPAILHDKEDYQSGRYQPKSMSK